MFLEDASDALYPMRTYIESSMTEEGNSVANMMCLMTTRIEAIAKGIDKEQIASFVHAVLSANRIYVMGAGRSGLVAKSFAIRCHFRRCL